MSLIDFSILLFCVWNSLFHDRASPPDLREFPGYRRVPSTEENGFPSADGKLVPVFWPGFVEDAVAQLDGDVPGLDDLLRLDDIDEAHIVFDSTCFDGAAAELVLASNRAVLASLEECLAAPEFQAPEVIQPGKLIPYGPPDDVRACLRSWADASYLQGCAMRLALEKDDIDGAVARAVRTVKLGRRVTQSQGCLTTTLVGVGIESIGLEYIRWILGRSPVRGESHTELMKLLDLPRTDVDIAFEDAFRCEALAFCNGVDAVASGDVVPGFFASSDRFFLLANETKRAFVDEVRRLLSEVPRSSAERLKTPLRTRYPKPDSGFYLQRNYPGKFLLGYSLGSFGDPLQVRDNLLLDRGATLLLVALRQYYGVHGELPARLSVLRSEELTSLPTDPEDGEPIRYDRQKAIVYGIGADGLDSGGSLGVEESRYDCIEADRELDRNEPTYEIRFARKAD